MATISEDYVSFETAKLLKVKRFDDPCVYVYRHDGSEDIWDADKEDIACQKPTLQTAMKWLREVHKLCIEPYRTACGYLYTISTIPYGSCKCNPKEGGDDEDSGQWTTYEGACEAAIKYCLKNLI